MNMEIKHKWLWIFLLLTLFGLLNVGVIATDDMANGDPVHWQRYLINELSGAWTMLPLLVGLFWFFKQKPITRENISLRLPLHLLITMLFGGLHTLLMYTVRTPLYRWFDLGDYANLYGILGYRFMMEYFKQFVLYWVFYGGYTLFQQFREQHFQKIRTAQLEEQLTKARLQALQMQLNPHFLFNTLNAISGMMYEDLDAADRMMVNLGDMLRSTFQIKTEKHALEQEVGLLEHYLKIMKIRFKDKLETTISIGKGTHKALIPVFLLQPLLENAIKYGVESKGQVHISLHTSIDQDKLKIHLTDNGPGIQHRIGPGVGLQNTMERLENHFGEKYQFNLANLPEGGLSIGIQIPLRFAA